MFAGHDCAWAPTEQTSRSVATRTTESSGLMALCAALLTRARAICQLRFEIGQLTRAEQRIGGFADTIGMSSNFI
jgi:hypothetical protein